MSKELKSGYTRYLLEIIGLVIATGMVLFISPSQFTYDEPYYLSDIPLIKEYGISKTYLQKLHGPAGPTHPVLHYLLLPVTGLKVLPVRMVNIILFIGCVILLNRIFKQLKLNQVALAGVAVPMTMVGIGMALTEIPAIFFMCLGIYFFLKTPNSQLNEIVFKLLSGVCVSFAILGRQPMLLVVPFFIYLNGFDRSKIAGTGTFLIAALALPVYCFSIWGGIIPSKWDGYVTATGTERFAVTHFILALGYTLLCFLLIAPRFLKLPFKIKPYIAIAVILVLFAIAVLANLQFPMLNTLASKVLPSALLQYYPNLCFALLMAAGVFLAIVFCYRLYENRDNKIVVFSILSCGAILFTTLAIKHQFSSRYVYQAFPFIMVLAAPYVKFITINYILRGVGVLIGLTSLFTYFS